MLHFGEILSKDICIAYTADVDGGYKVVGHASYNKDNKMTNAYGESTDAEGTVIARFSAYGGEDMRTNLNDVVSGKMDAAVMVTEEVLADLSAGYQEA